MGKNPSHALWIYFHKFKLNQSIFCLFIYFLPSPTWDYSGKKSHGLCHAVVILAQTIAPFLAAAETLFYFRDLKSFGLCSVWLKYIEIFPNRNDGFLFRLKSNFAIQKLFFILTTWFFLHSVLLPGWALWLRLAGRAASGKPFGRNLQSRCSNSDPRADDWPPAELCDSPCCHHSAARWCHSTQVRGRR